MRSLDLNFLFYSILLLLSDSTRYTVYGYQDNSNIVQERPTLRTVNDNIVIETPRNRNITLVPGSGGFVVMGKTVIDPNLPNQEARSIAGPPGPPGPQGPQGPKGLPGSPDSGADILDKLKSAGIDLGSLVAEVAALKAEVADLQQYTMKGTYPAIFEFYNNDYGERHNADVKFGQGGLMVMTRQGGVLLGQHIQANELDSGTTYAITFYLRSDKAEESTIDVKIAGSDQTKVYINDRFEVSSGDTNASFASCKVVIPPGSFKLTLAVSDSGNVLEAIGFEDYWLPYNHLHIDFRSMNSVFRDTSPPPDRRKK